MTVKKRGGRGYFDFQIKGVRYREALPEARTKYQAERAEVRKRDELFEDSVATSMGFSAATRTRGRQFLLGFMAATYIPWAKANKRTWRNDVFIANQWAEWLKGETLHSVS